MCVSLICIQRKKEDKRNVHLHGRLLQRRFSHLQILSSCVSSETEASGSLICFHSDMVDVSRKCHLFLERVVFFFRGAQEGFDLPCPSEIIK